METVATYARHLLDAFRQSERYIAVFKTWCSGMLGYAVQVGCALVTIRLTLDYLGVEQYGIWVVINSFLAIMFLLDLGIGQAIVRLTAQTRGKDGQYDILPLAASAARIVLMPVVVVICLVAAALSFDATRELIGVAHGPDAAEIQTAIVILTALLCFNLFSKIADSLRLGMQRGHITQLFLAAGQITNVCAIIVAIALDASLPALVIAAVSGTTALNLVNLVSLIATHWRTRPAWGAKKRYSSMKIIAPSIPYFAITLIDVSTIHADNFIIVSTLSTEFVAQNAIAIRIYTMPVILVNAVYIGLWAAYCDAELKGEYDWIRKTYARTAALGCLIALCGSTVLVLLMESIGQVLTDGRIEFDPWLVAGYWLFGCLICLNSATGFLMNALNLLRLRLSMLLLALAINIPLSIYLATTIGVAGPVWGTVVSIVLTLPISVILNWREIARRKAAYDNAPRDARGKGQQPAGSTAPAAKSTRAGNAERAAPVESIAPIDPGRTT